MNKKIAFMFLIAALSLGLAACEKTESMMISSPNDDTHGIDILMKRAGTGNGVNGSLTISTGECFVVNPDMERGRVEVRVYRNERTPSVNDLGIGDEPVLEKTVGGNHMTTYGLEPGDYTVFFEAKNNPTGTLMILPYNAKEALILDEALQEELSGLAIDWEKNLGE